MNATILDSLMSPVADCLDAHSLQALVNLRATQEAEERMAWLAERANEGELTPAERAEYESCIMFAGLPTFGWVAVVAKLDTARDFRGGARRPDAPAEGTGYSEDASGGCVPPPRPTTRHPGGPCPDEYATHTRPGRAMFANFLGVLQSKARHKLNAIG